jgi:hypothetical protein
MQRRKFSGEFKIEAVRARSREDEAILPAVRVRRDNQDENRATIRMRMRRRGDYEGRA